MKKRSSAKELLHWNANLGFPSLIANKKLTCMYLFDLNMLNIKSKGLVQECSKRKLLETHRKRTVYRGLFYSKGAGWLQ